MSYYPPVHDDAAGDAHDATCEICNAPCRWRVCFACARSGPDGLLEAAADLVVDVETELPLDVTDAALAAAEEAAADPDPA